MRFSRIIMHRCRSFFSRSHVDADLEREIDLHIEQLVKESIANGMSESEALAAAKREFGPVGLTTEQCRDMRQVSFIDDLMRDLVFALRGLRKSPFFAVTAILSLALGIRANTAIYSFLDAIMMRALPISNPENLFVVNWRAKGWPEIVHKSDGDGYKTADGVSASGIFPYPAWEMFRDQKETSSALFAFAGAGRLNLVVGNQASLGEGQYVSGNYFSSIGAPPAAGRLIDNEDDRAGATAVAVVSYRFWRRHFNGASNAVGKTILVNRSPFTIAGVTAPEFYGANPRSSPDIFLPLHSLVFLDPRAQRGDWFHERDNYWLEIMGRLRPGIALRQAEIAMAGQFHLFVAATATNDKERSNLPTLWLQEGGSGIDSLRRRYSKPLYILFAMTGLILAIACANLANLLLSRATTRRREIAVRLSLGAARWRIIRQLLTESVLLALLGGATGLFITALAIRFLTWLLANGQQDFTLHARIDARILLFTILVSVFTGILFGLVPAIQATKVDVAPALKESRTGAPRMRRFGLAIGLSHALVTGQIALSLLLVIAAGLFVTTLAKLNSVYLGFNKANLLVFSLNAAQAGYDESRGAIFYEFLRQRFAEIPGVRGATMTHMPLVAGSSSSRSLTIPGMPAFKNRQTSTNVTLIGPSFFDTMQIRMLLGRAIGEQDTKNAPPVAVINEAFVKKFFPNRSPIGQHFAFNGQKNPIELEIVGVAKDSLYSSLTSEVPPVAYIPWSQPDGWFIGGMYYEIRTFGNPLAFANTIRQIVHQANSRVPVADLRTQVSYIDSTIAQERTFANLCTCFGLLALLIAGVGLYGTMAYTVARRTNEIGIRIALGAQRRRVVWMVLREMFALSLVGVAIGLGFAWQTAHFVATFLFGVKPNEVAVFSLSALILVSCALVAGYVPARRAARVDPMEALRHE